MNAENQSSSNKGNDNHLLKEKFIGTNIHITNVYNSLGKYTTTSEVYYSQRSTIISSSVNNATNFHIFLKKKVKRNSLYVAFHYSKVKFC